MSMSQEEIESLMNGIDMTDNDSPSVEEETPEEEPTGNMSEDDIADLIAQTDLNSSESTTDDVVNNDDIDALLNELDSASTQEETETAVDVDALLSELDEKAEESTVQEDVSNDDIDELLASIDNMSAEEDKEPAAEKAVEVKTTSSDIDDSELDDILSNIEGMTDDEPKAEPSKSSSVELVQADQNSKVVNQLSQVANDSEEKAVQILDTLSYIMDDNEEIKKHLTKFDTFLESQASLLETLSSKFPNVEEFSTNLNLVKELQSEPKELIDKLNVENNELFATMELMQFHDINRQKIERVMSIIRKLSTYLNDVFEDDENNIKSAPVAKHIHGDESADLLGNDDLESLISEFGN